MSQLSTLKTIEYLVIGHISIDITNQGPVLGGTACYASLTANAMGFSTGVVTSWADDLPLGPMDDVILINHPSKKSTSFENIYTENGRIQFIHSVANHLDIHIIPQTWLKTPIVHLGPIANEVNHSLIGSFNDSMIGVTPQGWLRTWDHTGRLEHTDWKGVSDILVNSQVTILSNEDIDINSSTLAEMAALCPILVVTDGYHGCRVYWFGDVRRFNAPSVEEVDPTGAGDIFAAAFFIQYHRTGNPWESARFANQLAAQSVTRSGLASVPSNEEIRSALSEVF